MLTKSVSEKFALNSAKVWLRMEPVKLNKLCGRAEKKLGDIPDIQKKGLSLMFGSADFKAQDYLKVSYPRNLFLVFQMKEVHSLGTTYNQLTAYILYY